MLMLIVKEAAKIMGKSEHLNTSNVNVNQS